MASELKSFTDVLDDPEEIICDSQPLSLSFVDDSQHHVHGNNSAGDVVANSDIVCNFGSPNVRRPAKGTGQYGEFRSADEIDVKYRSVFSYPFFNLVQSRVIEDALYSDKSMVVCAPTGSGKTVVFEMAIVQLLMQLEDRNENRDFKIIYMAPVKALCMERLTEWYAKFTKLGLQCIAVTGDTDVDFLQLKPYRIIITTPEKWDMLTRRWRDHRQMVEVIKLFLIDEVHILNDETRGPVLEAVVSRMKTIEASVQSTHRLEQLQQQYQGAEATRNVSPNIRFVAVSATVSNPEDVAAWLETNDKPAVYYKFGDECRPVRLRRVVEGYHCAENTSIFKFDLVLNYKLWPIIQKYHNGKPTLIFCNTRKSVALTAETLAREITICFNEAQKERLMAIASTIKNKKLQTLVLSGVGCHHAGLLYEERTNIELAFRNRDLPILITTTTLAMGVNLPAHLVIIKNTQQYVGGAYQEYSISTVLQMVGRAGRPQFDTEATAVIMTRMADKPRYQALVGGSEPLQSYLHKRVPENLNSETALGTVSDVAQCVQWLRSTFLFVRAAKDPKRYLGLPQSAPNHQISKKIEELCVKAMNSLASSGLITMDEACCIESTEAGRLMSIYYLDLETMKHIMKINGSESLERLLWMVCECHELCDMYLRMDERRCLNTLNRNNAAATIRFPMKGKITTRQMKLNCMIQAVLGCLPIPDPALNQEAMKIMRIADRVCKCLVAYVTRPALVSQQPQYYSAILNTIILAKCVAANLWENSPYVSKQLKGIGPAFSTLLATAGKVNFMLLEESHPRDLERIMNKGPPAGNILRKQINLLPKYQLTMTPVDEKVVSTELVLLNHHNLSGNLDNLTAGTKHKSYVIIGDSENILLLLTSFTDKDLIGVYDGSITYQITRKHGFEHKIYAHCVSSTFAGLDAYCEYVFKDVEPQIKPTQSQYNEELTKKTVQKQTTITNTFRERKRNNTDNEISQSKEKKKRESAFIDNFKNLKESFGKTSKVLKEDLEKSTVMSEHILRELTHLKQPDTPSIVHTANVPVEPNYHRNEEPPVKSAFFAEPNTYEINDNDLNDEFLDEDQINNILNEIESEISKVNSKPELSNKTKLYSSNENECIIQKAAMSRPVNTKCVPNRNTSYLESINKKRYKPVSKNVPKKTNFSFIDLLEKNVDLSDDEETKAHEQNSFSDTIRGHIDKYLHKAKTNIKVPDIILPGIIQDEPISTKGTFIVQGSSRNKDDYNATINEIMLEDNTDSDKEKPTTDVDENYEENELPAIKLLNRDIRDDTDTGNAEEKKERRIITDYNNVEDNITSNKNIEPEKPINLINESKNTENICVYNTNDERELKKLEPVLGKDVSPLVPLIGTNIKDLDSDNMNIATAVDNKCSIVIPSSTKIKGKQGHEIQPPRQVEIKPRNNENIEIIEFSNLAATAFGIQSVSRQLNCKDILPIAVPRPIRHVPEVKEKQEFPMIDMWKKYIKELPSLELGKNNNEVTASNNTMSYDFDEPQTFTQRNDDSNKLPVALPTTIIHVPEVTENLSAIELPKNNKCIYIPPSKYHQFGATENLPPSIQNSNDKPSTLPSILDIKENQRLEIETPKNNKDIREITQTSAFDNHLVFTQQSYNSATNKELQNTHYHDPTTTEEIQSLLQTDPPRNSGKENKDITTFSFASSQPISTQHNYNFKLPFVLSNTVTRVPDLQQKQELPATELRKSTVQRLKDLTLFNNSNSFEFSNKAHLQNCNNDEIFLPKMASYTPESDETQRLEIKSPSTKDIPTYNNSTTYAIGNRPAFAEESNDYNYPRADKRTQYINRYSYSTNKTDVSTQEIADHVVRVTRKLILNLDVTEIVSNENKTMRKEEQVDDKNKNSEAFKKQKLESAQNIDHCKNVNAMVASYSSGFGNINVTGNPKELPNSDYLTAPQICPENQYLLPLPFMHFHAPSIEHCKNENARVASYSSGVGNINVTGNPKALSSSDDLSVAQKCPENQYLLPLPFMHFQAPNIEHCKNENAKVASYSSGVGNINVTGNPKALSSSDDLSAAQKCPENQCLLPLPSTTATKLLRSSPIVEFSEDNIELKEVGKDNEGVKNTFSEYKIADSPEENKPDSVQSILQKFIKNMGNNSSRNAVLPDSSNQRLVQSKASERTLNAAENYKPKILFKKSDIRRLSHTSLPSALMTKPKTVNVNERFTLLQTNNKLDLLEQNRQIKNYEIGISTPKKPVFNQDYNEDTQEHVLQNTCNIEDEDIPDYDQSIEDLEVKDTVSNIDPTMFNPKTLLQCYNNDEPDDIIPPPPEFSDFFNTTSDYINADTNSMDCYDPTAWEEDKYVSREGIPNRSIFQDYSQVELTPSKEIERWSLSEDEGNCKMYSSPGASPYSFTIKRENKLPTTQNAPHNSLPKNETLSRLNKLKQFKYNPKNMLKF